jgi:hypothetical protein
MRAWRSTATVTVEVMAVPTSPARLDGLPTLPGLRLRQGCSHWIPEERPDLIADQARALFG